MLNVRCPGAGDHCFRAHKKIRWAIVSQIRNWKLETDWQSQSKCLYYINHTKQQRSSSFQTRFMIILLVRFIGRLFSTNHLTTINFAGDVRHQLINLASLQSIKSSLLSVCLDVEVVVYTTKLVGKYVVSTLAYPEILFGGGQIEQRVKLWTIYI